MRRTKKRTNRGARGQALVIVALLLLPLLAFVGMAIDTGFAYMTQREEQTASDAASLDASNLLTGTAPVNVKAFAMAQRIAQTNGYTTNATACSSTTVGVQTVYVYTDTGGCGGGFTTEGVVKVPPD